MYHKHNIIKKEMKQIEFLYNPSAKRMKRDLNFENLAGRIHFSMHMLNKLLILTEQ